MIGFTPLTEDIYEYLRPLFWPEDDVLRSLTADLIERGPQIQVSPDEGRLLQLLCTIVRAERVLEIGTLFGYSGVCMARALAPDGHLDTIELSDAHADAAESWFERAGVGNLVKVHRGAALDVLPSLGGPYDVAFFDAVKREYPAYLALTLPKMRRGGLILCDNTLQRGQVADAVAKSADVEGVREFNTLISSDQRLLSTLIPAGDGLSISLVR
jgi:predicted O-methyltransferase YrrM